MRFTTCEPSSRLQTTIAASRMRLYRVAAPSELFRLRSRYRTVTDGGTSTATAGSTMNSAGNNSSAAILTMARWDMDIGTPLTLTFHHLWMGQGCQAPSPPRFRSSAPSFSFSYRQRPHATPGSERQDPKQQLA